MNRFWSAAFSNSSPSSHDTATDKSLVCCEAKDGAWNAKRVYRLWRQEGLKVPKTKVKKTRLGTPEGGISRLKANHANHVWAVDFIFDRTTNGRPLKILVVIDEYTRECLALEVGPPIYERPVHRVTHGAAGAPWCSAFHSERQRSGVHCPPRSSVP